MCVMREARGWEGGSVSTRLEFGMVVKRSGWGRMRPECTAGDLVKFPVRGRHGSRARLRVQVKTSKKNNLPSARRGPARRQMCRCAVENELERLCGAVCGVRWVSDGERVEFKIKCEKNE